ncbi:solute carrier organic anion transporter family member 4A1-like [Liolophura sinensis]|uniref:solute carrier organic anion transporter family member 4A1-like n=1 Tax=Liolophura sinensis TaxID=3198878 RepID=UPI003158B137
MTKAKVYEPMSSNGLVKEMKNSNGNHGNPLPLNPEMPTESSSLPKENIHVGEDTTCGWGKVRPDACQKFRSAKWMLFWLCLAGAIQGMVVNGFINVVISNIERRFDLSSTETGTIASCYDIASVLCLIPVSYFGGLGHKPRYLGIGILILGLGSFIFALPHFTSGIYEVTATRESICYSRNNVSDFCDPDTLPYSLSQYKYVFFLAQLLHGAGASPLYTLGVTYLDENLPTRVSPVYIGIYYAFSIVGPAIGYLAGGQFLNTFTDVGDWYKEGPKPTPEDPKYVGAWWIGFLISGTLALMVSLPLSAFPRQLPGSEDYRTERRSETYHRGTEEDSTLEKPGYKLGIKDILNCVRVLVTNPTFMFLNLAAACEGILLSGFSTFTPKFIESQFSLTSGQAAQFVGFVAIPAGGGGTLLGGYLVKRFDLRVPGIIRLCLCTTVTSLTLIFVFLVQCRTVPFAGVNIPYHSDADNTTLSYLGANLTEQCNDHCHCEREIWDPVCGKDNIMYFSPCYAGCQVTIEGEKKMYTNCSCIDHPAGQNWKFDAINGKCSSDCIYLAIFMPFFGFIMLLTFVTSMPALQATLRCVPHETRSFALGIQWIIARCLGSIPGPILFGKLIDSTCLLWQQKCEERGSCYFYDDQDMGLYLMGISMVGKALALFFFFMSLCLYHSPPQTEENKLVETASIVTGAMSNSALSTTSRATPTNLSVQSSMTLLEEEPNGILITPS